MTRDKDKVALHRAFEAVRQRYFPRWDREQQWRVRVGFHSPELGRADGYCDGESKTIWINPTRVTSGDDLDQLLIHEICHAIAGKGHTQKRFQARLHQVAGTARKLGRDTLAENIESEVLEYEETPQVTPKTVYSEVSDVLVDLPKASFEQVVFHLAQRHAVTQDQLLVWCPKLRAVYDEKIA